METGLAGIHSFPSNTMSIQRIDGTGKLVYDSRRGTAGGGDTHFLSLVSSGFSRLAVVGVDADSEFFLSASVLPGGFWDKEWGADGRSFGNDAVLQFAMPKIAADTPRMVFHCRDGVTEAMIAQGSGGRPGTTQEEGIGS